MQSIDKYIENVYFIYKTYVLTLTYIKGKTDIINSVLCKM